MSEFNQFVSFISLKSFKILFVGIFILSRVSFISIGKALCNALLVKGAIHKLASKKNIFHTLVIILTKLHLTLNDPSLTPGA